MRGCSVVLCLHEFSSVFIFIGLWELLSWPVDLPITLIQIARVIRKNVMGTTRRDSAFS